MPVRRPGGKYRGLIARNKSDADLVKEAREKLRRATEAAIRRGKQRSRRVKDPLQVHSKNIQMQDDWETEKQQRILNMLMGGKKGNLKKFFMAWMTGMELQKKENLIHEREVAWQSTCLRDTAGRCTAAPRLRPTPFELPFDALTSVLKSTSAFASGDSPSLRRRLLNSVGSFRPQSVGNLQDMFRRQEGMVKEVPAEPKSAWIQGGDAVMHYKSGRKYKLDPLSMRISPISDSSVKTEKVLQSEKPSFPSALAGEGKVVRGSVHFEDLPKPAMKPAKQAWASDL